MTTTVWQVARRPRWILMLLLALGIAAAFAGLSQWQLGRAVATATVDTSYDSETAAPLDTIAQPSRGTTEAASGQKVTVEATVIDGDYTVLGSRLNGGVSGFWVVGHLRSVLPSGAPADLPLAVGWTDARADADRIADALNADPQPAGTFSGRFVGTEGPSAGEDGDPAETLTSMSSAAFVNVWTDVAYDVYEGYLVSDAPVDGLEAIDAPVPERDVSLNWLNVFYAVEWVVFAGFALYLWFRLVKDTWEREIEEAADAAAAAAGDSSSTPPLSEAPVHSR